LSSEHVPGKEGRSRVFRLLALILIGVSNPGLAAEAYGGIGGTKHVSLQQITPANVHTLVEAWTFHTGDFGEGFQNKEYSFQTSPVLWNQSLFFSTSGGLAIAIDAATGRELWRFDARIPRKDTDYSEHASRGVTLWHAAGATVSSSSDVLCSHRVFLPTRVGTMAALDALTGRACTDFGKAGVADLRASALPAQADIELGLGDYGITSPPVVYGDLLIVGSAIGDNRAVALERGLVRAINAQTGKEVWRFDPIPRQPDDPASSTWEGESASRTGAANAWAPLSIDVPLGLVFVPTSSPSPDFYGGERLGDNRYANSIVALNAQTGQVVWHQQLVHHDVWDYDVPAQPVLVELDVKGERVPAVVVATKTGMLFSFRRNDGVPIHGMEERAVPASDVRGERLSPTQPFSSIPALVSQKALTAQDAFGLVYFDRLACADLLTSLRTEGIFTPPSLQGSIMNPGWAGGINWGGVAIDPERQIAIANVNQLPGLVRLIPRESAQAMIDSGELEGWDLARMQGTPYLMARRIFLSPLGLPCTQPPWGKLVAVDLRTSTILWERPLGTVEDLAPAIVPNFEWGMPNIGGPLVTASGLIFIGAAAEHAFRAFDVKDGKELWKARLPTSANATPISYEIDGEQFVVVAAGGHGGLGTARGDGLHAFKLPAQ